MLVTGIYESGCTYHVNDKTGKQKNKKRELKGVIKIYANEFSQFH